MAGMVRYPLRSLQVLLSRRRNARGAARSGFPLSLHAPTTLAKSADFLLREWSWLPQIGPDEDFSISAEIAAELGSSEKSLRTVASVFPPAPAITTGGRREPRAEWEPHRLQILVPLARWFRDGRSDAADLATSLLQCWTPLADDNEIPAWESPMEVGLRLVSLTAASSLLQHHHRFAEWWHGAGARLLETHATWLRFRIEDDSIRPSNHAIANAAAMACYTSSRAGCEAETLLWADRLEKLARRQLLADGGHYERSTGYHRYVVEAFLCTNEALRHAGIHRPILAEQCRRAVAFLESCGNPLPLIGDHDGSRFLRPFAGDAGPHDSWRALSTSAHTERTTTDHCTVNRSFGIGVLRCDKAMISLSTGIGGQNGRGGHAHNDQLSLTLSVAGEPWIVDPGTSTYLGDPSRRYIERASVLHSSITVEDEEVYPICVDAPFALIQRGRSSIERRGDGLIARHRPRRGVLALHERELTLMDGRSLSIRDSIHLSSNRARRLCFRIHLFGSWSRDIESPRIVLMRDQDQLVVEAPWCSDPALTTTQCALEFGTLLPSTMLMLPTSGRSVMRLRTLISWFRNGL